MDEGEPAARARIGPATPLDDGRRTGGNMAIVGFGLNLDGRPLFSPMDEQDVADSLRAALARNAETVKRRTDLGTRGVTFRASVTRPVKDVGDPRQAGWSFLLAANDPRRAELIEILRPLAELRGMEDPGRPLVFGGTPGDESSWGDWLQESYWALTLEGKKVPHYVMLVGDPARLPFGFQALLDTVASVGRLDLDAPADIAAYVQKIVRLERATDPVVDREALFFATDAGPNDATSYSRKYMADPLSAHVKEKHGLEVFSLAGSEATKANLVAALQTRRPALVYTASHGLGLIGRPIADQKRLNGAICCQARGEFTRADLFSGDDVPTDRPFLEGAIFFQFACFGAGTPSRSDYTHWLERVPEQYADEDFVAALPKKLLAHPRGPVAFVGHLDTAWLHGFADPNARDIVERWHTRIAPFVTAVDELLRDEPAALAMQTMNERYAALNGVLTNTYDREKRGALQWTSELARRFVDTWILRSDAQNYMVLGDPAAALQLPPPR